jgi:HEAT repeat protein
MNPYEDNSTMDQSDMRRLLDEITAMRQRADSRPYGHDWTKIHALAEAGYEPARDFFLAGLTDSRAAWRELCLQCLGFHYIFPPDGEIAETIRQLLLNDPNDMVRIAAASVLGVRAKWPDPALKHALQVDRNKDVRQAACAPSSFCSTTQSGKSALRYYRQRGGASSRLGDST